MLESTDRVRVINVGRYVSKTADPVEVESLTAHHEPVDCACIIYLAFAVRARIARVTVLQVEHARVLGIVDVDWLRLNLRHLER